MVNPSDRLILALDVDTIEEGLHTASSLKSVLHRIKVGHQLYAKGGLQFLHSLMKMGYKIFLDLKMHDIPNSVRMGVEALAGEGIWALTLHSAGGRAMLEEALEGRDRVGSSMLLLGVTVLTSMNEEMWQEVALGCSLQEALRARAEVCAEVGIPGLVCSPLDLPLINKTSGRKLIKVVPGIRPSKGSDDQVRTATPRGAVLSGANYLVVGRPILRAENRQEAVRAILKEIEGAIICSED